MSTPISVPQAPPQPADLIYSISALDLFKTYDRESYFATFGVQAPLFDPTKKAKVWFDSTADTSDPNNIVLYKQLAAGAEGQTIFDAHGHGHLSQLVVPASEAAAVNLPGPLIYSTYVVAPTDAKRGGSPINPIYLSTQDQAIMLMATLNALQTGVATGLIDAGDAAMSGQFPVVYPADEPRRRWPKIDENHFVCWIRPKFSDHRLSPFPTAPAQPRCTESDHVDRLADFPRGKWSALSASLFGNVVFFGNDPHDHDKIRKFVTRPAAQPHYLPLAEQRTERDRRFQSQKFGLDTHAYDFLEAKREFVLSLSWQSWPLVSALVLPEGMRPANLRTVSPTARAFV